MEEGQRASVQEMVAVQMAYVDHALVVAHLLLERLLGGPDAHRSGANTQCRRWGE